MGRLALVDFVQESNRIEGILRSPSQAELDATAAFLSLPKVSEIDLRQFVSVVAPGHILRDRAGLNVRVGSHIAPLGGPEISEALRQILYSDGHPYHQHIAYETLHPFTDGNGRSGRVLWLWAMGGLECAPLGFLHHWYYQSLEFSAARTALREATPEQGEKNAE